MFNMGWSEFVIVALVALLVIGPKEMPRVVRSIMGVMRKLRQMATEFQDSMEDIANDADIKDIREEMQNSHRVLEDINYSVQVPETDTQKKQQRRVRRPAKSSTKHHVRKAKKA